MLAHVAGIPLEEALQAAPALLAGLTVFAGYLRAAAARPVVKQPRRLDSADLSWSD